MCKIKNFKVYLFYRKFLYFKILEKKTLVFMLNTDLSRDYLCKFIPNKFFSPT